MIGLIYSLNFVITVALVLIMIYSVGEMELIPKKRNIYIIIFVGIILVNSFILHNHREIKSSHGYSTNLTYDNMLHMFRDVERYKINDISDIKEFNFILERLRNQSGLLVHQLENSVLVEGENDILKDNLSSLTDELHKFIIHHNRLYTNGIDNLADNIPLYNEFKSSIIEFGNQINGNQIKEKGLGELSLITDLISEINLRIIDNN